MGTIREYEKQDGSTTYHAEVRLKGHRPKRASFATRRLAEEWIEATEAACQSGATSEKPRVRHDWTLQELQNLFDLPFGQLVSRAMATHRAFHVPEEVQCCQLISIKTGGCSEDCSYCAQSSKFQTFVKPEKLMQTEEVLDIAKRSGATRVCLGAAWRQIRNGPQFDRVLEMVKGIKEMGMEVCCCLGMLEEDQIRRLKSAGLYAYNHNLDTSADYYRNIVTSHTYEDRLNTLDRVARAGVSICCGGIVGLGESPEDRLKLVHTLATRDPHPESVPLNRLVPIEGTPLSDRKAVPVIEFVRLIALARITMPRAMVRLSAGRLSLSDGEQALCFLAGANSIFVGDRLLTTPNPERGRDQKLLEELGMRQRPAFKKASPKECFLSKRLNVIRSAGLERKLSYRDPELIDFSSNDYLGLANSLELAREIQAEFETLAFEEGIRPGIGATGSRLLTGNHAFLEQLEEQIAAYHSGEAALLFNSGYAANAGLLSCVAREEDAIILDSQVHASTWDGARLSRAKNYLFPHNDLDGLEKQLKRARRAHRELFVCVESLYSMAGDLAPLADIRELCLHYRAELIVDEAHATGIAGPEGRGLSMGREPTLARIYTFGKGLGCHGAAIVGSHLLRDYLVNQCRTFIYTTAFPLHSLVTIKCIYERLAGMEAERAELARLSRYFQLQVANSPLPVRTTPTAVQSIPVKGAEAVTAVSERLRLAGLDVRAMRSPTVRSGNEALRICLHAFNTEQEIDSLVKALINEQREVFVA